GVSYDGKVFSNFEIGLPFELIATFATEKSIDVNAYEQIRTQFRENALS
ncbi:MAG: hypothetical protein UT00_C0017G0001, partial [Parcubacteria group bacterium GW2011_GWA1_38_7]